MDYSKSYSMQFFRKHNRINMLIYRVSIYENNPNTGKIAINTRFDKL